MNYTKDTYVKSWVLPFLLALGGVVSDYISTIIGLSLGFHETNPQYHPLWALLYFWGVLAILTVALPRKKTSTISVNGLALASYIGAINNVLVMLGIFQGLGI